MESNPEENCPICLERLSQPVVAADGHTYDVDCIKKAIARKATSPLTNEPLPNLQLVPNYFACTVLGLNATPLRAALCGGQCEHDVKQLVGIFEILSQDRTPTHARAFLRMIEILRYSETVLQMPASARELLRLPLDAAITRLLPLRPMRMEDYRPDGSFNEARKIKRMMQFVERRYYMAEDPLNFSELRLFDFAQCALLNALPEWTPNPLQREIRADAELVAIPAQERPREMVFLGGPEFDRLALGMRLPDGTWLNLDMPMPPPRPWHSMNFLLAFVLMTAAAALLILWAVRRLTRPVATLAAAAEALGRDVNAPPLPETGPTEVAIAAGAFNTMAARIRRFVQDRTFLLTAIGHDLRTPITRLKLRVEFMEDDELRRKMLDDLDELESMVSATLVFGRDATANEPISTMDLSELVRTVLDETADARPSAIDRLVYQGPDHLPVRVRPVALKRALTNLVSNAAAYGGGARVTLAPPQPARGGTVVTLHIDDDGPGIPESEMERVFLPFHRLETSRNRETETHPKDELAPSPSTVSHAHPLLDNQTRTRHPGILTAGIAEEIAHRATRESGTADTP